MQKVLPSLILAVFLDLCLVKTVQAQEYVFEAGGNNAYSSPQELKNAQNYKYIYGILTSGEGTVDYYSFELNDLTPQFHIELFVPAKTAFQDFRPSFLVTEPHTKQFSGGIVPYGLPFGLGGRIYPWEVDAGTEMTEKDAFQTVWAGPALIKDMTQNHYNIGVFDPAGRGGRYMLKVGSQSPVEGLKTWLVKLIAFIRVKTDLY